jgi:hypothetical protein
MIRNARIQLTATAFNNLAVALIAIGVISPMAAGNAILARMIGFVLIGGLLHLLARRLLGRLT